VGGYAYLADIAGYGIEAVGDLYNAAGLEDFAENAYALGDLAHAGADVIDAAGNALQALADGNNVYQAVDDLYGAFDDYFAANFNYLDVGFGMDIGQQNAFGQQEDGLYDILDADEYDGEWA
jgi:hypothetical protein